MILRNGRIATHCRASDFSRPQCGDCINMYGAMTGTTFLCRFLPGRVSSRPSSSKLVNTDKRPADKRESACFRPQRNRHGRPLTTLCMDSRFNSTTPDDFTSTQKGTSNRTRDRDKTAPEKTPRNSIHRGKKINSILHLIPRPSGIIIA